MAADDAVGGACRVGARAQDVADLRSRGKEAAVDAAAGYIAGQVLAHAGDGPDGGGELLRVIRVEGAADDAVGAVGAQRPAVDVPDPGPRVKATPVDATAALADGGASDGPDGAGAQPRLIGPEVRICDAAAAIDVGHRAGNVPDAAARIEVGVVYAVGARRAFDGAGSGGRAGDRAD